MKYLKKYKLFESTQIDYPELEDILIDFKQMGLKYKIEEGSTGVFDWEKSKNLDYIGSAAVDDYTKSNTNNSLAIYLKDVSNDVNDLEEAYEMLKVYLFDNYDLIPNYIYFIKGIRYIYFENFDKIISFCELEKKEDTFRNRNSVYIDEYNILKADWLVFGFYKD